MTGTLTLHPGDNRDVLRQMIAEGVKVHSVVCDPPYFLESVVKRFGKAGSAPAKAGSDGRFTRQSKGFMGRAWDGAEDDGTRIAFDPEFWALIYDVLLPGGYVLAFSSPRTGHWQACAMETAGFIMHPFLGWLYGCLDDQSEALTQRGWLPHTDLRADDQVMQWDSATGALSWVTPSAIHDYPFDGEMVTLKNRHTNQVLTPNHRVYAKIRKHSRNPVATEYQVVEASVVGDRSSAWQVDLPMAGILTGGAEVDSDYAYLVGWWLTDAWPHADANACMFSQCKPATLAKLRAALAPHSPAEYVTAGKLPQHSDEHTFYLTGPLADRLRSEHPERALTWDVLAWSLDARKALFEGLMDGDGSRSKGDPARPRHAEAFWSVKQERRDVFVALGLSLGFRCYDDAENACVHVNLATSSTQIQGKHRTARVRYTGRVWCVTVPSGAFVARRNGRPFITGNSGFPKAHSVSKALDKAAGAERKVTGVKPGHEGFANRETNSSITSLKGTLGGDGGFSRPWMDDPEAAARYHMQTAPATPEAQQWDGWFYGTQSLKPALEPIYMAQKPFETKTGFANVLMHGTGAVNIDGCRVPGDGGGRERVGEESQDRRYTDAGSTNFAAKPGPRGGDPAGRWPANFIHDGSPEVVALFPTTTSGSGNIKRSSGAENNGNTGAAYGAESRPEGSEMISYGDTGSAARFFNAFSDPDPIRYQAKAGKTDRAGSKHPTVKPVGLMEWLCRLVTPPGGTVLDPFAGSGTTGAAALTGGFNAILIEREPDYLADIRRRFGISAFTADMLDILGGDDDVAHPGATNPTEEVDIIG